MSLIVPHVASANWVWARTYAVDCAEKNEGEGGSCSGRARMWRSFEAVEFATLEWVDWFNNRRLLEPVGNIPPAEAKARYYAQPEGHAIAA